MINLECSVNESKRFITILNSINYDVPFHVIIHVWAIIIVPDQIANGFFVILSISHFCCFSPA